MSLIRSIAGTLTGSRKLAVGVSLILILVVLGLLSGPAASWIGEGQDPVATAAFERWLSPSPSNPLGTDQYGRDIFIMVLQAISVSLQIGALAGTISVLVGGVVAFVAGYNGGVLDTILSSFTSIVLVIPTFPLLIALSAYSRDVTLFQVGLMLSIFSWPLAAKTIRAQVLSLRTRPYVELAKVTKSNTVQIIVQELLPNLLPFIVVGFATSALGAIFGLIGLEVIGLGPSGVIDLGHIIYMAMETGALTLGAWPMFVAPIALLTVLFAGLNYMNIGLEEVYNPRLRKFKNA